VHRPWFSSSSGELKGLRSSVGARLCSDVVGYEAHAEWSVASDDRLGMEDMDEFGPIFGAEAGMLCNHNCGGRSRSPSQCTYLVVRDCVLKEKDRKPS